ncbi:MAG: Fe(3+) ABC transporter substrate-binding protein [Rhizobiales bacterium]|nr:Fe(3+) ABC transporter substrate-binding protein [Hyphomicrobiales bacterium]
MAFRRLNRTAFLRSGALALLLATATGMAKAAEINIYSYRQPQLIEPLLAEFTRQTGIVANVVFAKEGLAERISAEGANSPADLLLTTDVSRLEGAKKADITQQVSSPVLDQNIPAQYRDPAGNWFGLTTRARVIYVSKERVNQDAITYEELADPKWKGRICTRSGQHDYTLGLIGSIIAHSGEAATRTWLEGVKQNLARRPTGNDRSQVESIFSGECDIALGNTYYMGLMQTNDKEPVQKEWAASVKVLFPNTDDRGTHVNLSGMVLAKHAPNRDAAVKLMEFLASDTAQKLYAEVNYEYPVKADVDPSDRVKSWGMFKADNLPLSDVARLRDKASELVDIVGFDKGPNS